MEFHRHLPVVQHVVEVQIVYLNRRVHVVGERGSASDVRHSEDPASVDHRRDHVHTSCRHEFVFIIGHDVRRRNTEFATSLIAPHYRALHGIRTSQHVSRGRHITAFQGGTHLGAANDQATAFERTNALDVEAELCPQVLQQLFITATTMTKQVVVTNEEMSYTDMPYQHVPYKGLCRHCGKLPREGDHHSHVYARCLEECQPLIDRREQLHRFAVRLCKHDLRMRIEGHDHCSLSVGLSDGAHPVDDPPMSAVHTIERTNGECRGSIERSLHMVVHDHHVVRVIISACTSSIVRASVTG